MRTEEEIIVFCKDLAAQLNVEFDCRVMINGRLKRTMGKVVSYLNSEGSVIPEKMEFSKNFLKTATENSIRDVVIHEFCHWYLIKVDHQNHGHDNIFKELCVRLGASELAAKSTYEPETITPIEETSKYEIICPSCGVIGKRQRASKVVKNIEWYRCSHCGNEDLSIKQNF